MGEFDQNLCVTRALNKQVVDYREHGMTSVKPADDTVGLSFWQYYLLSIVEADSRVKRDIAHRCRYGWLKAIGLDLQEPTGGYQAHVQETKHDARV